MIVVQLRGCNASGKSTIVRQFVERNLLTIQTIDVKGEKIQITTNKDYSIVVLGRYDKEIGGCDLFKKGTKQVYGTIVHCIKNWQPKIIVYEGVILSTLTTFTRTVYNTVKAYGYKFVSLYLHRKFDNIIKLLEKRNGGASYNINNIISKYKGCFSSYKSCKKRGLPVKKIDVDGIKFEDMYKVLEDEISIAKN